jgi:DNA-binding GntR family transcriptional regulator
MLAAHFRTSRGPLREALQALGEQGLISFTRNRGAFVRQLDLEEAEELYDLRAALDDEVGRKLAGKLSEQQSRELQQLLEEMEANVKANDIARYYPNNLKFHDLLVVYAANRRLADVYRRIIRELHLFRCRGSMREVPRYPTPSMRSSCEPSRPAMPKEPRSDARPYRRPRDCGCARRKGGRKR